jgi:hypothetical protein
LAATGLDPEESPGTEVDCAASCPNDIDEISKMVHNTRIASLQPAA